MSKRVLVVGAGIIGASFAYHLAKGGADVRVVDAGSGVGGVATPNSWAWINASWGNPPDYFRLRFESMRMWHMLDKAIPGLNVNWCGGLLWDLAEKELLAFADERRAQGYGARIVDRAEASRLEPNLVSVPHLALHVAQESSVEPVHAVERLLAAAQALGADVLHGVGVRWLMAEAHRITGVMTNEGAVEADVVVLAAGVGCRGLLKDAGISLALDEPTGLLVHSKPAPELLNGLVMAPELHVRQTAEGRLIAGTDFGGADPGVNPEKSANELFAKVRGFLKGGSDLQMERYSVGVRPTPRDGVSAVGFVPSIAGVYCCVSHSGITLAPVLGALGAAEILEQGRGEILRPFAPDRLLTGA